MASSQQPIWIPKKGHFVLGLVLGAAFIVVSASLEHLALPLVEARGMHTSIVAGIVIFDRIFLAVAIWYVYAHCHLMQGDATPAMTRKALFPGVLDALDDGKDRRSD